MRPPVSIARRRFRRILTALRLFERGGYALGPVAWTDPTPARGGRSRSAAAAGRGFITLIPAVQEDELRAFCNLIARRAPTGGELAWALARFEMGCERLAPFEALTDYLLALRALLEPEGPGSGRLAQRLAVLCAQPAERTALAERTAHAISLERAVITGLAPAEHGATGSSTSSPSICGRCCATCCAAISTSDLRAVADELLAEAAAGA